MRVRPSVPAACAVVALVSSVMAPALAATPEVPAAGRATSAVSLLSVSAAGHDLAAGGVRLVTDTIGGVPSAQIVVTPLTADGVALGVQTVDAGTSRTVAPLSSSAAVPALAGIASVTGPALEVGASVVDGAASTVAGATSLGRLEVLGLPIDVHGLLTAGSAVDGRAARSAKTLEVSDVELPSIADLLAALGLDLGKLPAGVLDDLVARLDLANGTVATANAALDAAQAALGATTDAATAQVAARLADVQAAGKDLSAATAALDPLTRGVLGQAAAQKAAQDAVTAADAQLAERQQAAAAARSALAAAQALLRPVPGLGGALQAVDPTLTGAVTEADALVAQAQSAAGQAATQLAAASTAAELTAAALAAAQQAVTLAQSALAAANRLLDTAQQALTDLSRLLAPQLQALLDALMDVLDGTPVLSLRRVAVSTESVVTGAGSGQQRAVVEGGTVEGLEVLGTDVLQGRTLDLAATTGPTLATVGQAVAGLTGALSSVLSSVPGLPALKVPAPTVQLLTKAATTAVDGDYGTAGTTITGLTVTVPAITLPVEVALPGALALPGLSLLPKAVVPGGLGALAVGDLLTSTPTTLGFGSLSEGARFRPAVTAAGTATPTTGAPTSGAPTGADPTAAGPQTSPLSLPRTGASAGLAVLGLLLAGGAAVVRRRRVAQD